MLDESLNINNVLQQRDLILRIKSRRDSLTRKYWTVFGGKLSNTEGKLSNTDCE